MAKEKSYIYINEDYRVTNDKLCFHLEKRCQPKGNSTRCTWGNIGYYKDVKNLLNAIITREIFEQDCKIRKIMSKLDELEKILETIPNLFINGGEKVVVKERIIKETKKIYWKEDKRTKTGEKVIKIDKDFEIIFDPE
jgi:hypothetical protein